MIPILMLPFLVKSTINHNCKSPTKMANQISSPPNANGSLNLINLPKTPIPTISLLQETIL